MWTNTQPGTGKADLVGRGFSTRPGATTEGHPLIYMVFHMDLNAHPHQCQYVSLYCLYCVGTSGVVQSATDGWAAPSPDPPSCFPPLPYIPPMRLLPCAAPSQLCEAAPITSLPFHNGSAVGAVTAFWDSQDRYVVCITPPGGGVPYWYEGVTEGTPTVVSEAERRETAALMAGIVPLGYGRVRFARGYAGRAVFRGRLGRRQGEPRPTVLGARAARSHRQPA